MDSYVFLVSRDGMFLSNTPRRGLATHIWTNDIRKARFYTTISALKIALFEMARKYPYQRGTGPKLEGLEIAEAQIVFLGTSKLSALFMDLP